MYPAIIRCPETKKLRNVYVLDEVRAPINHYIKNEALVLFRDFKEDSGYEEPKWVCFGCLEIVEPSHDLERYVARKFLER